ncbi:MAG: hypothetical protein COV67_05905, partial [Nitrospinae bacterium CG11_big_fil_rev_8_21_14_0_20_56_8]
MNILHIIPRFTTGGAERLVLRYVRYQQAAGMRVSVASVRGEGELIASFEREGVEALALCGLSAWLHLRKFIRDEQIDIIHSHVFSSDVIAFFLKRSYPKVTWISTEHNVAKENSPLRQRIIRRILPAADKVIAVSPAVYQSCLAVFRVPRERCLLIENGIDLSEWEQSESIMRRTPVHLASIGRLTEQKGQTYLLEALAELRHLDWKLTLLGDGPEHEKLRGLVRVLGLAPQVFFAGVEQHIESRMKHIDIVVQPSLWEGRSLVIMEAMAAGRLVIASAP